MTSDFLLIAPTLFHQSGKLVKPVGGFLVFYFFANLTLEELHRAVVALHQGTFQHLVATYNLNSHGHNHNDIT